MGTRKGVPLFLFLRIRVKERAALRPEMLNLFSHKRFADAEICRKTTDAEKIGGSPIDHALVNGNLIGGKFRAALTALAHFFASLQR